MRLRSLFAIAALASASLIARASTVTFNIDNLDFSNQTLATGGTVTGTLTFNTSTDLFTSADLTASGFTNFLSEDGDDSFNGTLNSSNYSQGITGSGTHKLEYIDITMDSGNTLDLFLPVSSLVGYNGGQLCASNNGTDCHNDTDTDYTAQYSFFGPYDTTYTAQTGSLDPGTDPAPTPEPSSLILLGTGLIGVAGALRRRIA